MKLKSDEIRKWRIEIDNAEDFKQNNWGDFKDKEGVYDKNKCINVVAESFTLRTTR